MIINKVKVIGKGYGQETERELKEMYDYYNETLFDNELPSDITIEWNNRLSTVKARYIAKTDRFKGVILSEKIDLNKKYHKLNDHRELSNSIIHEMIHVKYKDGGHGENFQRKAREINRMTGLNISTTGSEPNSVDYYRYEFKCLGCGMVSQSNVKVDNRYVCATCNGKLKTIKTNK